MNKQTVNIDVNALYAIDNLTTDEKNKIMKEPDKFRMEVSFFMEDCVEFFDAMLQREIIRQIMAKANFKGSPYKEKDYDEKFELALAKCMKYLKDVAVIANEKDIRLSNVPLIGADGEWLVSQTEIELAIYGIIDQFKQSRLDQLP